VTCRACGATLAPLPALLTARDYTIMLALIDGSDRKYAPKTLDTVAQVTGSKAPKEALKRLRAKLRRLLVVSQETTTSPGAPASAPPDREEIMRKAKTGEISWDEALKLLEEA